MIARRPPREKSFNAKRFARLAQATFGGQQWPHSVTLSRARRPASVGRPQHSHAAGRTQLMTLPAGARWTAATPWLERLRTLPRAATRALGNRTTTLIWDFDLSSCIGHVICGWIFT